MLLARVAARRVTCGEPVVNVSPVIGTGVGGIDAELLDGVDRQQHALHVRPARDAQKDVASGPHGANRGVGFTWRDGAENVDARDDGAVIVAGPADKSEDAAGCEAQDALTAINDLFGDIPAKSNPVLDLLLEPDQLDMGEHIDRRDHDGVPPPADLRSRYARGASARLLHR